VKLLLEEMLSPAIARELTARGIFMSGNYRRTKDDIGRISAALEAKINQYPDDDDLANAEDWL
jgi:hypothetical protein